MVESLALLEVVGKELGRGKYFLLVLRELALVEIAIHTEQFFGGKAAGFLSQLIRSPYSCEGGKRLVYPDG